MRIACTSIVAARLVPQQAESLTHRAGLPRDGMRVVGAFAALFAAALLLTAGLLWRENARPRPQPVPTHVSVRR